MNCSCTWMLTTASSACVCMDVPKMVSAFWRQVSQRTGTGKPMSLGHAPRIASKPLWGGSVSTLSYTFVVWKYCWMHSFFAIHWSPCSNAQHRLFHNQLTRKFIPDQMISEVPSNVVFYHSIIPCGTWLLLPASFPGPFSGTQPTSVGRRVWRGT